MNKIEIEIPVGKEVDWEASAKQKQIVLKDKQFTYKDVCNKLFNNGHYFTYSDGSLDFDNTVNANAYPNNATTKYQLECILAKNQLANVAKYLNDGWEPNLKKDYGYCIEFGLCGRLVTDQCSVLCPYSLGKIIFKSKELAQRAIQILGEKTIKLALLPLY